MTNDVPVSVRDQVTPRVMETRSTRPGVMSGFTPMRMKQVFASSGLKLLKATD